MDNTPLHSSMCHPWGSLAVFAAALHCTGDVNEVSMGALKSRMHSTTGIEQKKTDKREEALVGVYRWTHLIEK